MNQTPKDSPQAIAYKKGDIVWVLYRGKEFYPARVNAYYPKERKISHIWFPLNRKSISAIFKADLSRVRPFKLEDSLPDNASQELEYSYDQAVRILQGTSIEEILEENDRMMEEMGIPVQVNFVAIVKNPRTHLNPDYTQSINQLIGKISESR
ncbi:unnamed protein product [Meloidogyne enterolobii]|uniref:Uncharacterized protein n=1 Tax=Meloidogyne enterolobii TaxID=390850 RepID=A0ACB0YL46_MELEN